MIKYFSERSLLSSGIALLILIILSGCEKNFDEVVDVTAENYQVTLIAGIKDTVDLKNPADSLLNLRIIFSEGSEINKVYFNVLASDKTILNSSPVELFPISETIFENNFVLKRTNPIGNYSVNFFVTNFNGENKQVAVGYFYFNNGQDNVAPMISNLVMPDTIQTGQTITFSADASDGNGLNDIEFVFYETYNPNGIRQVNSQGIFQFPLFDDGKTEENGDVTARDGRYTVLLIFPTTALKGTWRFEFQARDRSGLLSNKIIHNIVIQ